jgi:hypothetical protein
VAAKPKIVLEKKKSLPLEGGKEKEDTKLNRPTPPPRPRNKSSPSDKGKVNGEINTGEGKSFTPRPKAATLPR